MALEQLLAQMGAVPQGATPMNIDMTAGQTTPRWQDTSPMGVFLRQLEAQEKKKQEEQKRKADLYNTLRQAGYSSKEAYESVESGKFTMPSGEGTDWQAKEKETKIKKTEAETKGIEAKTEQLLKHDYKIINKIADTFIKEGDFEALQLMEDLKEKGASPSEIISGLEEVATLRGDQKKLNLIQRFKILFKGRP